MRTGLFLSLLIAGLIAAGCGGDSSEEASVPGGADPDSVEVIEGWADELRAGEIEAAANRWDVPSIAQNGTAPLQLGDREAVIAFNESLPCGAELTRAESEGEIIVASFELSERPGPGQCGSGDGNTAKVGFVIEDDKIVEWRRVAGDPVVEPPVEGPVV